MNRAKEVKSRETIRQPRKRHSEALSNKFYWIYQESDVFDDKEILFIDSRTVVRESTTIEQAKREVQSFIRSIGGNTAMHLNVEKMSAPKTSWAYYPARYSVSANAALVVPKSMREEKKDELCSHIRAMARLPSTEPCKVHPSLGWKLNVLISVALLVFFYILIACQK